MSQQYVYLGTVSETELAYLALGLCFVLAVTGWLMIAEPVKHVKNTHHKSKTKAKTTTRKPAKSKPKKK